PRYSLLWTSRPWAINNPMIRGEKGKLEEERMTIAARLQLRSWGLFLVVACALASIGVPALAQQDAAAGYPKQPIKILVGFAPGGSNDLIARIVAQKFGERLGQPAVVENKPGAGGIIAAELATRSAPDGYTLMMGPAGPMVINPAVYAKLPY